MAIENMHFVPDDHNLELDVAIRSGNRNAVFNLFRYWWAWAIANHVHGRDATVWDMGCGCGYGSRIMAEQREGQVFGFDYDRDGLSTGARHYAHESVRLHMMNLDMPWFSTPDLQAFSVGDAFRPDVIVCFETLEFLQHREMFLLNCSRVLKPDGLLLLSMPFAPDTNYRPAWQAHRMLYSPADCRDLVHAFFDFHVSSSEDSFPGRKFMQSTQALLPADVRVGDNLIMASRSRFSKG